MRILMAASELTPIAKVGGLADVVPALAKELAARGHEVRIVCPLYGSIKRDPSWKKRDKKVKITFPGNKKGQLFTIWDGKLNGGDVTLHFIECPKFFGHKAIYGVPGENFERFAFFSRAVLELCVTLDWMPDILHCHDWMTALIPVFLEKTSLAEIFPSIPTVLTIHNLAYQGSFDAKAIEYLGLGDARKDLIKDKLANYLKAGLLNASKITTVSPSYAQEILTRTNGCGLDSILKKRKKDLLGIINGIDSSRWNPEKDARIVAPYSLKHLRGKEECKLSLQEDFGLAVDSSVPIFAAVARLYYQKGIDLLVEVIPEILKKTNAQIVVQGMGDPLIQKKLERLGNKYKSRVGVYIGYCSECVHRIISGSDFFVMPSRYEPCGLTQMYSMQYGCVPIVRATGGLKDTVVDISKRLPTGMLFNRATASCFKNVMFKAARLFSTDPIKYSQLQRNGMKKEFTWKSSVLAYEAVYKTLLAKNK